MSQNGPGLFLLEAFRPQVASREHASFADTRSVRLMDKGTVQTVS